MFPLAAGVRRKKPLPAVTFCCFIFQVNFVFVQRKRLWSTSSVFISQLSTEAGDLELFMIRGRGTLELEGDNKRASVPLYSQCFVIKDLIYYQKEKTHKSLHVTWFSAWPCLLHWCPWRGISISVWFRVSTGSMSVPCTVLYCTVLGSTHVERLKKGQD